MWWEMVLHWVCVCVCAGWCSFMAGSRASMSEWMSWLKKCVVFYQKMLMDFSITRSHNNNRVKLNSGLPLNRRMSHAPDIRIPLNAKIITKNLAKPHPVPRAAKKKKKSQEKRQETKAAKTLSAILLSFIITWTPYNILVLLKPL